MMSDQKLRLIEKDFKERIHISLGTELSSFASDIQVIPIPVTNPSFQTVTESKHFFSSTTKMGIDFMLIAKAPVKRPYIQDLFVLAAMSVSSTITPIFVEGAIVLETSCPFTVYLSKKRMEGKSPIADLLRTDKRFQRILKTVKEDHNSMVDVGNRRIKLNLDQSFQAGVIPFGLRTIVAMRSLPGFSYGVDNLYGVAHVFNYGVQRSTIEILGRLAYYVEYLAYPQTSELKEDSDFLIQRLLVSLGMLQEGN